jgi:hypothetical protein
VNREQVLSVVERERAWLAGYGPASQDLYDYWAWGYGRWAKSVYYRRAVVGSLLVAPLVLADAFVPNTRRLVRGPSVFPIALAQYADALLRTWRMTREADTLALARRLLDLLIDHGSDVRGVRSWGYPFDWQTCFGNFAQGTPLITTMPYVYDAFVTAHEVTGEARFLELARSTAVACCDLFPQTEIGAEAAASAYTPYDARRVINASAYRGHVLADAGRRFNAPAWTVEATRNLRFVLQEQRPDGSWPYAVDGRDGFVDNFHTCFVLKNLTRAAESVPDLPGVRDAVCRGYSFYGSQLLDEQGLPIPFAVKPRLTMHDRELYDYAEGINLAVLLEDHVPDAGSIADRLVEDLTGRWQCPDGHFRTRHTVAGWNTIPYHRWAQSPTMRALACYAERR